MAALKSCVECGAPSTTRRCKRHGGTDRSPSSQATGHRRHKERRAQLIAEAQASGEPIVCSICGEGIEDLDQAEADHVVPLALRGADDLSNYALAHRSCNRAKGARG